MREVYGSPPARLLLLAVVAAAACSQFRERVEYDPGADFARLHTYAWLPLSEVDPADQRVLDRYIDRRIREAVARTLGAKGYAPAGGGAPDFLLNYRVSSGGRTAAPLGYYPGSWYVQRHAHQETYDEGTLLIDVVDGATRTMIWRGAASTRLLPHISLERRVKRVDAAVAHILADFPPR